MGSSLVSLALGFCPQKEELKEMLFYLRLRCFQKALWGVEVFEKLIVCFQLTYMKKFLKNKTVSKW